MRATIVSIYAAVAQAISIGLLSHVFGDKERRLIKVGPEEFQVVTETQKLNYRREGINFIDVTNQLTIEEAMATHMVVSAGDDSILSMFSKQLHPLEASIPEYSYPTTTAHNELVDHVNENIDLKLVKSNLADFTSFYTRYYKSDHGLESANWLFEKVSDIVSPLSSATVKKVHHDGWDQFSIIVSIPGVSKKKVIVGAHQDSINLLFPNILGAPGANDDGSGTVTTLEALRLVVSAIADGKFTPYNTLEFHYYSAEEGGLLGSIDIFTRYFKKREIVLGMLQQDMTGYSQGMTDAGVEHHFGLITDYTTPGLNKFLKTIAEAYCSIPVHETKCGYACSDHASALEKGYPASFFIESEFQYTSKYIHLVLDTLDRLDFGLIGEHIKLTVGYAIELSLAEVD
ncbi:Zn-dependent exopeptidase [Metschnikowia bicuspidata]|uniref:Peptide hydrolase n=1 Tax=Metschnikowia bicuspidata TaxID=27322 RepID=A0A4P9ZK08_9ASCO|nr:Zn-dependent exopeptidase [Metschnikowia bicuspidata]